MRTFFISIVAAFQLLAAPADVSASMKQVVPPARTPARTPASLLQAGRASNAAAAELTSAKKRLVAMRKQKDTLRRTYNAQLTKVDTLKRARASWRRDRKLREQKAWTQKTALALGALDLKIRAQSQLVLRRRKEMVSIVGRELSLSPSAARTGFLHRLLSKSKRALRKQPKKILIPDLELDEFADPEELLEQISLIERAEARLAAEEASLGRRATHYAHMDVLRSKRQRADELTAFDDDQVRRKTGRLSGSRQSGGGGTGADADLAESPTAEPGGVDDAGAGSFEASSVVLSDVVDAQTHDALRRAHRSSSPRTKALAAQRAHEQVQERIRRLRASKTRIRSHLRRLSKQR